MNITKGNLTFTQNGNHFTCLELGGIPDKFKEMYSKDEVEAAMRGLTEVLRSNIEFGYPSREARDSVAAETRKTLGIQVLDEVLGSFDLSSFDLFQQFLYWMSNMWWYNNTTIGRKCSIGGANSACHEFAKQQLAKFIIPILPAQVGEEVKSMEMLSSAVGFGHFAFLFSNHDVGVRRIVTDTCLIELRGVNGYDYLDIDQHGNPIARCCCMRGGERAFFDGVRLMSHDSFHTCAPKTVIFDRGYKFNSTRVSVINGVLYPLIDADDAVAKTTGAFFGVVDYTRKQFAEASELAEQSAARLSIDGNKVHLDGRTIKPMGTFLPSGVTLLESGFSLYDWSEFEKSLESRYDHVMVVDDRADWIAQIRQAFGGEISNLVALQTNSGDEALEAILKENPEALILDMHLTEQERFDGLFVANQLIGRGYTGAILIASSYGDEQLKAMSKLIRGKVSLPGKNVARIRDLLAAA